MKNKIVVYQVGCILLLIVLALMAYQQHKISRESQNTATVQVAPKNDAISVIQNRKSVRTYVADKAISKEDVETLLRAGMAAPSGKDTRPWEFLVINDRSVLNAMAEGLPYAKMLTQAPMAIVVCGDTTKSSYWYLDCSAASQNILLAAEALGLGAVWTAAYPYEDRMEAVAKNTNMPANICPLVVIPVGYPDGNFEPKNKFDESKIYYNTFGKQ